MPTLQLYASAPPAADVWHRVVSPGGYEGWHFDAEDETGGLRIVADFFEGFISHPNYLRRYARYRRHPTRHLPPLPRDYPCVGFTVYEQGRVMARFMCQYQEFFASDSKPDLRIGPNHVILEEDGSLRVQLRGTPWGMTLLGPRSRDAQTLAGEFSFRPSFSPQLRQCDLFFRKYSGGEHHWIIARPHCRVKGTIYLYGHAGAATPLVLPFNGRGYHDHRYGNAPIGSGLKHWVWGRVLLSDRSFVFHIARPNKAMPTDEVRLIEADATEMRPELVNSIVMGRPCRTKFLLTYPSTMQFDDVLSLHRPRVLDSSPFDLRVVYEADCRGRRGNAFCQITYPHRLRRPILGRLAGMTIDRKGCGNG